MKNRKLLYTGLIILGGLLLSFFDLSAETQKQLIPFTPQAILDSHINLGLDLQGGAQLDYKIDLRKVPETDKKTIVNGILNVINERVNKLGVAEPNIYTSDVGDEKHLIVELAGIKDLEKAKAIVGKTIQLEFKELAEDKGEDPNLEKEVKEQAQKVLDQAVKDKANLQVIGEEEQKANPGKVIITEEKEFKYRDEITGNFAPRLFELEAGQVLDRLVDNSGDMTIDASGKFIPGQKGFHIIQTTEKRETEKTTETPRNVKVSHILIAYKGAQKADKNITRTKEEAQSRAKEAINKLNEGGDFTQLAKEYSDDLSNKESGGTLLEPAAIDNGKYVKEFETAALTLTKPEEITKEPIESPFGYHIIKANEINEAKTETTKESQVKYLDIYYPVVQDPWEDTGLNGQHFARADVDFTPTMQPYVSIVFDDEGAKMFEELTRKNLHKPIAIFVGGELVSAPNVNEVISGGRAQITGQFTMDEANELARDLNTGAIPAPITLAGQYSIGATLGQDALSKSIYASLIGFILLAIFMILYYKLPGVLATIALGIYSVILLFLVKISLDITWALGISVVIFTYLIWRILKNHESGAEKAISAILTGFILFFATFILNSPIVLTLAGIAGIILSIGMAVDANILIFERIKEELKEGRTLNAAIEVGFKRAWSSIRDSNFSSLITCAILFYFGSSIIQGFAFNLAAGILVSMFSAITLTKTLLEFTANTKLGKHLWLYNAPKNNDKKLLGLIKARKATYTISTILIAITLISLPIFGMKLGLDFTGGTLMEIQFEQSTTPEKIKDALTKAAQTVKQENPTIAATTEEASTSTSSTQETTDTNKNEEDTNTTLTEEDKTVSFEKSLIVPSGDKGYIIKTPHISTAMHDKLLIQLKTELGQFEESRFSTVGPTVGQSLQSKAIWAILIAVIMIILYIAFAFRHVPRSIGKWKFGITAIAALVHDLMIMLGVYIYLGMFLGVEIDALFITAMLTVLGFSVHDTIVVFDRIRERLKYQKRDETFEDITNQALNETMTRSLNTSISTLIVLLMLATFGAESIRYFVIALLIGIVSGTYSSIFIATPLLVTWQKWTKKRKA